MDEDYMNNRDILSEELKQVHKRFEQWRQQSGKVRLRIPEDLWEAAANVARTHGVNHVAKALRLEYNQLKERSRKKTGLKNKQAGFSFVELMMPGTGLNQGSVIELINPGGIRMIVRFSEHSGKNLQALAEVFLRSAK